MKSVHEIYNEFFGVSHGAALQAVWDAAVAEGRKLEKEAAAVVEKVEEVVGLASIAEVPVVTEPPVAAVEEVVEPPAIPAQV